MSESRESFELVLCLGSNHGDRRGAIASALDRLRADFPGLRSSGIYETPAVSAGGHAPACLPPYMNAVAIASTPLMQQEINDLLKKMEAEAGRDESARARGEVPLDIDIVCYAGRVVRARDFSQNFFRIGYDSLTAD